jgi:hypothetical protein
VALLLSIFLGGTIFPLVVFFISTIHYLYRRKRT